MELALASGCRTGPPAYVNTVKKEKKIFLTRMELLSFIRLEDRAV
jgi:hypothetical protein